MSIVTTINNWLLSIYDKLNVVAKLQIEVAKLEAYVKALEAGAAPELKAKIDELEGVLDGWRSHALNLAVTLEAKVKADLEKL